jgi:tetratricopeptide (TPR) repeat protein
VDAAHMVAIVERDPDVQLIWNLRALELALKTSDERAQKWPGSLQNNIGWSYHDTGEYELALEQFEEALEWRKKEGNVRLIRIAEWCIGRAMRSLGQVGQALKRQQELLRQYEADGEMPGYTYEEIGECLYMLNQREEAKPYFSQAYAVLSQDPWLQANEAPRLARLKLLSE